MNAKADRNLLMGGADNQADIIYLAKEGLCEAQVISIDAVGFLNRG
jgi:hypothetical protein